MNPDVKTYYEVKVSAENPKQADDILRALLGAQLVTGGQIIEAPAKFLWKGAVTTMPHYCIIWSYTTNHHRQAVIDMVKTVSVEEVPMVWFAIIEGNDELTTWIDETLA